MYHVLPIETFCNTIHRIYTPAFNKLYDMPCFDFQLRTHQK